MGFPGKQPRHEPCFLFDICPLYLIEFKRRPQAHDQRRAAALAGLGTNQ